MNYLLIISLTSKEGSILLTYILGTCFHRFCNVLQLFLISFISFEWRNLWKLFQRACPLISIYDGLPKPQSMSVAYQKSISYCIYKQLINVILVAILMTLFKGNIPDLVIGADTVVVSMLICFVYVYFIYIISKEAQSKA